MMDPANPILRSVAPELQRPRNEAGGYGGDDEGSAETEAEPDHGIILMRAPGPLDLCGLLKREAPGVQL